MYYPDSYPFGLIGPAEVIRGEKIWIRIHPSIFDEAFAAVRAAVGIVRDLRGELDSFELVGPMSGDILSRVLRPVKGEVSSVRTKLISLSTLAKISRMGFILLRFMIHDYSKFHLDLAN